MCKFAEHITTHWNNTLSIKHMKKTILTSLAAAALALSANAQNHELTIDMKRNGAPIQKTMYGLFIEDINYAADGGLYAELVKNRSFDFP